MGAERDRPKYSRSGSRGRSCTQGTGDEDEARETPNPEQHSQEQSSREGQIEETENTTQEWSGGKEKEVMNGTRPMDHRRAAVPDNIAASRIQICRLAYPAGKIDEKGGHKLIDRMVKGIKHAP
ncbi:hypothetical protein B0H17DRAFT_1182533 [Mycena rosella]|uniref:Uncharacterized protein n=1 Tax=Mycena rosella TaxID=1033263 RepID=A0AAD7D3R5_MYCRO|nr:hypothetical protein B0H17DRAFT_1182533 [Mycena rosella]